MKSLKFKISGLIIGKNGQNMENILNGSLVNRIILENETDVSV